MKSSINSLQVWNLMAPFPLPSHQYDEDPTGEDKDPQGKVWYRSWRMYQIQTSKAKLITKTTDAPRITIFRTSGACSAIFVIGGGIIINAHSTDCPIAVKMLLATYYVLDLNYPRMFAMVLCILQTFLFNDPYRMETSHQYKFFIKKVRKSFDAITE